MLLLVTSYTIAHQLSSLFHTVNLSSFVLTRQEPCGPLLRLREEPCERRAAGGQGRHRKLHADGWPGGEELHVAWRWPERLLVSLVGRCRSGWNETHATRGIRCARKMASAPRAADCNRAARRNSSWCLFLTQELSFWTQSFFKTYLSCSSFVDQYFDWLQERTSNCKTIITYIYIYTVYIRESPRMSLLPVLRKP